MMDFQDFAKGYSGLSSSPALLCYFTAAESSAREKAIMSHEGMIYA